MANRGRTMVYLVIGSLMLLSAAMQTAARGDHHAEEQGQEHASAASKSGSGNPLIEEMLLLDGAFREWASAVAVGDGQRVSQALHTLHGTMEKTHEGVHHGTVQVPKNAGKIATFVQMDRDFHGNLERLEAAAKKNDQQAMLALTKKLLDGCVNCHGMFRK